MCGVTFTAGKKYLLLLFDSHAVILFLIGTVHFYWRLASLVCSRICVKFLGK